MKIAIHHRKGSFSERWIEYCTEKDIPFKIVNAYDSDIVKQVEDCDVFMWHHLQNNYKDALFAKQLLYSLETTGKKVFPDFHTGWHFDDKVGQKYLLESVGAPLVPSYVFYTKKEALDWVNKTSFPKVFKLRGGAGSENVRLVHSKTEAKRLVSKAFGHGLSQYNTLSHLKDSYVKWKQGKVSFWEVCRGIAHLFIPIKDAKFHAPQNGYVYFQDFIPDNKYDIRVIVIGNKAFAIKRMCRPNDFRASGSGNIIYDSAGIDSRCVKMSFEIAAKLKTTSIATDWVCAPTNEWLVVEISYGFDMHGYDACPGYWTNDMQWHQGKFNPQGWMVDEMLK